MTWVNLDDNFADHPKVLALSDGAFRLHVAGICYCARYLTDGAIPAAQVAKLAPNYTPQDLTELVKAGLWVKQNRTAYEVHDYLQWNRSRESVLSERARKSEAGKRGARKRWHDDG